MKKDKTPLAETPQNNRAFNVVVGLWTLYYFGFDSSDESFKTQNVL